MHWLYDLSYLFGGAFLVNAVPHLVSGVRGEPFQTPFAKPPGQGLSPSSVNVLWAVANLVVAYLLLARFGDFALRSTEDSIAAGLGLSAMALLLARIFGRVHGGDALAE